MTTPSITTRLFRGGLGLALAAATIALVAQSIEAWGVIGERLSEERGGRRGRIAERRRTMDPQDRAALEAREADRRGRRAGSVSAPSDAP